MASFQVHAATVPSQLKLGFHRHQFPPLALLRHSASPSCFKNAVRLQVRHKLWKVCASSNSSPSGGDSTRNETEEPETSGSNRGPPLLTILAGFLVFALVCWLLGSIIAWLFGLVVKVSPI